MRTLILVLFLLLLCCEQPTEVSYCTVEVIADISSDYNPYKDLWVIIPPDSIIRSYNSDTLDTISVFNGQQLITLYYLNGNRDKPVFDTLTVENDGIRMYFNNTVRVY